jgi:hypothetical protein
MLVILTIKENGFPKLSNFATVSQSLTCVDTGHKKATVKVADGMFNYHTSDYDYKRKDCDSSLWNYYNKIATTKKSIDYASESDIAFLVRLALTDIIFEIGFKETIRIVAEVGTFGN